MYFFPSLSTHAHSCIHAKHSFEDNQSLETNYKENIEMIHQDLLVQEEPSPVRIRILPYYVKYV